MPAIEVIERTGMFTEEFARYLNDGKSSIKIMGALLVINSGGIIKC